MDVTDLARRLIRRWLAVAQVGLIAVLAAGAAWVSAGPTEQSSAAVVIVPPTLGQAVYEQNPLLNLDNNLSQLATVLASAMGSPEVTDLLRAGDATAPFTISTVTGTNPSFAQLSPQIVFTVTADSAGLADRTSSALVHAAQYRLDELQSQAGAPESSRARLVTVVSPTDAVAVGSGRLRAAGAVGLGVLVLGLLGVLLLDELLSRRSARRRPVAGAALPVAEPMTEPTTEPVTEPMTEPTPPVPTDSSPPGKQPATEEDPVLPETSRPGAPASAHAPARTPGRTTGHLPHPRRAPTPGRAAPTGAAPRGPSASDA